MPINLRKEDRLKYNFLMTFTFAHTHTYYSVSKWLQPDPQQIYKAT